MLQHRCGSALQSSLVLCEHRWSSSPAAALRPWDWNRVALVLRFLLAVQQCCRKVPISVQFRCKVLTVCSHSIDFSGRKRVQAEMKSLWFTVHLLERRGEAVCPSCTPAVPWPAVLQPLACRSSTVHTLSACFSAQAQSTQNKFCLLFSFAV